MEFGIFNVMGAREAEKPAALVFSARCRRADEARRRTRPHDRVVREHHFSNCCLCASPLMMVAHCASITKKIRLGTAVVVLPVVSKISDDECAKLLAWVPCRRPRIPADDRVWLGSSPQLIVIDFFRPRTGC